MIFSNPITTKADGSLEGAVPKCLGWRIVPGGPTPGGYPLYVTSREGVRHIIESDAALYFDPEEPFGGGSISGATPSATYTVWYCQRPRDVLGAAGYRGRVQWEASTQFTVDTNAPPDFEPDFTPCSSTRNIQVYLSGGPGDVRVWQQAVDGSMHAAQTLNVPAEGATYSLAIECARPVAFQDITGGTPITCIIDAEAEIG